MTENCDVSCRIKDLGAFHLYSFNFVIHTGLKKACMDIDPVRTNTHVTISVSDAVMKRVQYPMDTRKHKKTVYPSEARLQAITYYAELDIQLCFEKSKKVEFCNRTFYVPVMLKSDLCFLRDLNKDALIKVKEDIYDPGGYFIVKGKERIFRHFIVPKRNYPLAVTQNKWKSLKENFSEYGILIRSIKDECIFSTVSLHFLNDGCIEIRLFYNLTPYYIQVMLILKALVGKSDTYIIQEILKYYKTFPVKKLKNMLQELHIKGIHSHEDAKHFVGEFFYPVLNLPQGVSYYDAADYLLKKSLLVHLDKFEDKFEFLCFSLCKLLCTIDNGSRLDDLDNPVYQEVLSSGQTYLLMVKEGITSYLKSVRNVIQKSDKNGKLFFQKDSLTKCCNQALSFTPQVASMIATGNFTGTNYGFRSNTGYTVSLKRTNVFELASQFTGISKFPMPHYLRQTRMYYPESWGFLCPTQTPEGENCGLHNYLASQCKIVDLCSHRIEEEVLFNFGVIPYNDPLAYFTHKICPVFVDGRIIGWINHVLIAKLLKKLRELKSANKNVPYHSEIVYISKDQHLFSGVYLFSSPCRMVRKVLNLQTEKEEYIGVFEQVFLQDMLSIIPDVPGYSEINEANILSLSSRMIPFCEHNAAVRNIFSSEKCKQAVGLPFLNFSGRSDSKTHELVYGQSPIVSSKLYSGSDFDLYPHGTNVIVAVISYSGYDMEDAIVLNKASVERGLMQSNIYKTIYYDFGELATELDCMCTELEFKRNDNDPFISDFLDADGFPFVGARVKYNDPILSVYNKKNGRCIIKRYLERYNFYIHSVRLLGGTTNTKLPKNNKKLSITFCVRKVPEEGDKFNNRHGGKGICSALMSPEDLPFTASGMVPDVLFNPNGLPSRMSMGVLFEMAMAKAKIHIGCKYMVEAFESNGRIKIYDSIGEALEEGGFSYYGTENFYSGTSGLELEAEVFCGCIFYLRLHHMVQEKYQVRSVGPIDERTLQPINPGRSGAIRFGEMERDAILSHGAAELTRDRLLLSSDKCDAFVCPGCHTIMYPILQHPIPELRHQNLEKENFCRLCHKESTFKVQIPFVLCYLICELAVLGISIKFSEE